jgi:hypothetical protein
MPEWRFQHEFCRGWVFGEKRAAYRTTPNGSCKPAIEGREYIGKSLTEERLRRGWSPAQSMRSGRKEGLNEGNIGL